MRNYWMEMKSMFFFVAFMMVMVCCVTAPALVDAYSISGTVTYKGTPMGNVKIFGNAGTVYDAYAPYWNIVETTAGAYIFRGSGSSLPPGTYTIRPSFPMRKHTPSTQTVTIANADVTNVNFTQEDWEGGTVSGKVTYNGFGIEGVSVHISDKYGWYQDQLTDASGSYSFRINVQGAYQVSVSRAGYSFTPLSTPYLTVNEFEGVKANNNFTASYAGPTYSIKTLVAHKLGGTILPLQGVVISLSGMVSKTATTDATGQCTISGLLPGFRYNVSAAKAGYQFAPPTNSVLISSADATAVFNSKTYGIYGKVTLQNGAGVDKTAVTATLQGTATSASVTTDTAGNFVINGLYNGTYVLDAKKPGYSFSNSGQSVAVLDADKTANISATFVGLNMTGLVTHNGVGKSGITVNLSGAATRSATTGSDGSYTVTGLPEGNYTVIPGLSGQTFTPASQAVTISGGAKAGVNFVLSNYSISGTVYDNTVVMPNATLTVTNPTTGAVVAKVYTSSAGAYSSKGLLNGSYTITPSKPGYYFKPANWALTVAGANIIGKNLTGYVNSNTISGTVTVKGLGKSGVTVALSGAAARATVTDAQGNYAFTGLAAGEYKIVPNLTSFTFTPVSRVVKLTGPGIPNANFNY